MSYINENNTNGIRTINANPSKSYHSEGAKREINPEIIIEKDVSEENGCQIQMKTSDNYQQQPNNTRQPNNNYPQHNEHFNDNHEHCNDHSCDKDSWDCDKKDNCCNTKPCSYNPSKAKCVCTYADIILVEEIVVGSTLFLPVNISSTLPDYTVTTEYKPTENCCNPCTIDATSVFSIESTKALINNFNYVGTLVNGMISVNGTTLTNATFAGTNVIVPIDSTILNEDCDRCNEGTVATVLLNGFSLWNYIAKFELCGKVTTNGNTCKFKSVYENKTGIPTTITNLSTFVAPQICIPSSNNDASMNISIDFGANGKLINPAINVIANPAGITLPAITTLKGSLMLNTNADLSITKNTKICFNAMM